MRIAYLCADFGIPVFGTKGASIHVRELTSTLASLGHEVLILTPRGEGDRPPDYEVPLAHIELDAADRDLYELLVRDETGGAVVAREIRTLLYGGVLRRRGLDLLREFRPEVVIERYSLFGREGIELARALDVPLIVEVNAPITQEQAEHRGLAFAEAARAVERDLLQTADRVVTVS